MNLSLLLQTINSITPLSNDLMHRLGNMLKEESFAKREHLVREGQVAKRIYFIQEGFARAYYFHHEKEFTNWFMGTGDFMISIYSFFTQQPALENIELLENTVVYSLTWAQLQSLYKDFPEFNIVGRVLTEKYYMMSEERSILLRTMSATDRYHLLVERYPQILLRAKLGQVASYLAISQETLSRIRANKNI